MNQEELNKEITEKFFLEVWNNRKFELLPEIFSEDFIAEPIGYRIPTLNDRGPESMRHHIEEWLRALPDVVYEIKNVICQNDQVSSYWIVKGTQIGEMFGIPATNKLLQIHGTSFFTIKDGKINHMKTLLDTLGLLQQVDILPGTVEIISERLF